MTAEVKTEASEGGGSAWLRIDDGRGEELGLDNQQEQGPLKGDSPWSLRTIVLDVPNTAETLNYGSFQMGGGATSIRNVQFERVGPDVPTTGAGERSRTEPAAWQATSDFREAPRTGAPSEYKAVPVHAALPPFKLGH
ncbi:MAG TPA: hypothetical protein VEY30_11785 [Myxococcaceae bacterium]|nr:hypothetical protein [Myxococcaceae bacterium]